MGYICAYCDDEFSDNVMCPECVHVTEHRITVLTDLLREASAWLIADSKLNKDYVPQVMALRERIDKAIGNEEE